MKNLQAQSEENDYVRIVIREIRKANLDPANPYRIAQQVKAHINICVDSPSGEPMEVGFVY